MPAGQTPPASSEPSSGDTAETEHPSPNTLAQPPGQYTPGAQMRKVVAPSPRIEKRPAGAGRGTEVPGAHTLPAGQVSLLDTKTVPGPHTKPAAPTPGRDGHARRLGEERSSQRCHASGVCECYHESNRASTLEAENTGAELVHCRSTVRTHPRGTAAQRGHQGTADPQNRPAANIVGTERQAASTNSSDIYDSGLACISCTVPSSTTATAAAANPPLPDPLPAGRSARAGQGTLRQLLTPTGMLSQRV